MRYVTKPYATQDEESVQVWAKADRLWVTEEGAGCPINITPAGMVFVYEKDGKRHLYCPGVFGSEFAFPYEEGEREGDCVLLLDGLSTMNIRVHVESDKPPIVHVVSSREEDVDFHLNEEDREPDANHQGNPNSQNGSRRRHLQQLRQKLQESRWQCLLRACHSFRRIRIAPTRGSTSLPFRPLRGLHLRNRTKL